MPDSWPIASLGDHVDLLTGFPFKSADYCGPANGVPLLRGDNIVQRRLRWDGVKHWPQDRLNDVSAYLLQPHDVVLAMDRPWIEAGLKVAAMRLSDCPALLVQRVARLRGCNGLDQRFLKWLLYSPDFTDHVLAVQTGTAVPHISGKQIREFRFALPSLEEQRRIAGVLGAIDDLIDTNRKIADDCTALWRALVRDTLEGATDSVPLTELARFVNGRNFTKDASGHGRPVIRTPEVRRGPQPGTLRSDGEPADEFVASEGDILFVWSGSLTVGRWLWEDGLVNQHVFKVLPKPGVPDWLVYATIEYQMPWFLSLAADKATTMGHIKREHLDAPVPIPSAAEIKRLGEVIEPLWNAALQCGVEIQELTRTRNELLPLLLSARLRVDEVAA